MNPAQDDGAETTRLFKRRSALAWGFFERDDGDVVDERLRARRRR